MREFYPGDLAYLDGQTAQRQTFPMWDSSEPDDLPDFLLNEYLTPEQHAQKVEKKGWRTVASIAVGIAGFGLNKLGEQLEKDSKIPKVVTQGMQYAGRAAVIGSKIMTPLFIADTAFAKYVSLQAKSIDERERAGY